MEYTEEKILSEEMDQLKAEVQETFWREYEEYIAVTPMSRYERRLLRDWVGSCHSVYHDPGSKYLPDRCYEIPFLDAYREDREIARATRGMSDDERFEYINREYLGWEPFSEEELRVSEAGQNTPQFIRDRVRLMKRDMIHLWEFICQEGLTDEAREYVKEHRSEEAVFEWCLLDEVM